jgi:hypothetical protein
MRIYVFIAMILMATAGAVFAQTGPQQTGENKELKKSYLYQWTDDKGVVHITDGLGSVPPKYRDKALKMEQTQSDEGEGGQQGQQETFTPVLPGVEEIEEEKKAEWQLRIKDAKHRLAEAEQRYRELDQKRMDALGKWGGPASGHREGAVEAQQIEAEMQTVQKEIDNARHDIDVVIPEEARKAGVPPSWLRE